MWTIFGTWVEHTKWSSFLQVQLILESLFVKGIILNQFGIGNNLKTSEK
jgi:hypothetical protein